MRTIKQIKEDIGSVMKKLGDLRALCVAQNRDPSEEERAQASTFLDEVDELEAILASEIRSRDTIDRVKGPDKDPERTPIDTRKDKQTRGDRRDHFASPGEFYQAVMRAGTHPGQIDPRLSTRAATGLSESVPSDGGFLVETENSSELMKNIWTGGQILPLIQKTTLSGNKNAMKFNGLDETSRVDGSRAGGIRAYWKDEAAEKTKSKPTFRKIDLTLHKLIGLCYATDELLDDASALAATINDGFKAEFDFKLVDGIINGTGAGQPLGILNAGCVVTVGKEAGQAADTIVWENVSKMKSRLMASSLPKSVWIINQDCEPQLNSMSLAVGTGGVPVYMPAGGASVQPYGTLFGRPVIPLEHCQSVGTTGDIMLCDFSQYKAIDKGGMQGDVSIHVEFISDESVFRFVYRFDGQPVLASEITPFKGTNTLSHFVKLASRD